MGMYTRLSVDLRLKNIPNEDEKAVNAINVLLGKEHGLRSNLPNHPFFDTHYWRHLSGSPLGYHTYPESKFVDGRLIINCEIKNYFNEIELFLDWISKYYKFYEEGEVYEYIGWMKYEESIHPTLIYFDLLREKIVLSYTEQEDVDELVVSTFHKRCLNTRIVT